jgi:hypothetical protein
VINGAISEDGKWMWQDGGWRQLSDDGRHWWDGQRWRPMPGHLTPDSQTGRGAGAWTLIVIGGGLLVIGLLRVTFGVLGGLMTGHLDYALGRATVSAIFLILPGLLLAKRGLTGRWLS